MPSSTAMWLSCEVIEMIWFLRSSYSWMKACKSCRFFCVLPPMKCLASTLVRGRVEPLLVAIVNINLQSKFARPHLMFPHYFAIYQSKLLYLGAC